MVASSMRPDEFALPGAILAGAGSCSVDFTGFRAWSTSEVPNGNPESPMITAKPVASRINAPRELTSALSNQDRSEISSHTPKLHRNESRRRGPTRSNANRRFLIDRVVVVCLRTGPHHRAPIARAESKPSKETVPVGYVWYSKAIEVRVNRLASIELP